MSSDNPEMRPNFNPLVQHTHVDGKSGIDQWARAQIKSLNLQLDILVKASSELVEQVKALNNRLESIEGLFSEESDTEDTSGKA